MDFDFRTLAFALAAISFGLTGAIMAGSALFTDQAEQAKRTWLPTTIQGLVLIGVSAFVIATLSSSAG